MSRIERLLAKPKEIELGGEKFQIKPLTVKDMPLIMKLGKDETQGEAMNELVKKVLKEAEPNATDEELDNISMEHLQALMEAIMEVNNLKVDSVNVELLKKLKK